MDWKAQFNKTRTLIQQKETAAKTQKNEVLTAVPYWLPTRNTQQTFSNVISEYIPYYYVWRDKMQSLNFGQKPSSLPKNKVVNQRELRHHRVIENYVNPVQRALNFKQIMEYIHL